MAGPSAARLLPGAVLAAGIGLSIGAFLVSRDSVDRQIRDSFHLTVNFEAASIKDHILQHERQLALTGTAVRELRANGVDAVKRYALSVDYPLNFPGFETVDYVDAQGILRLHPFGEKIVPDPDQPAQIRRAMTQKGLIALSSGPNSQTLTWIQPVDGGAAVVARLNLAQLIRALFRDRAVYTLDPEDNSMGNYFEMISISSGGVQKHLFFPMPSDFQDTAGQSLPYLILGSGCIISILLFVVYRSLSGARDRALALAEKMTEDLRSATQEAVRANQAKSEFLASMSHEIRNPIHVITGMSEVLSDTELSPDQHAYLKSLRNAGEHLLGLINDILDLSRIESGLLELEKVNFSLREAASQVIELYRFRAEEKHLELRLETADNVVDLVRGDPVRFRQILVNLVGNAMKFTAEGSIVVSIEPSPVHDPGVHVSVKDTGIGIPPEKQSAVFEKFTQVDASTTRRFGGTGLGLAICKRLTDLMGGTIGVESTPGKGSTFFFRVGFERAHRKETRPESLPQQAATGTIRILLADDAEDNRNLIALFLRSIPHELTTADNGQAALDAFEHGRYDVILMDGQMPVMDGLSAVRRMREIETMQGRPRTKIFALTADSTREDVEKSLNAGCDGHLTKPIRKDVLIQTLREATAG